MNNPVSMIIGLVTFVTVVDAMKWPERWLEARFRYSGKQWFVQLIPEGLKARPYRAFTFPSTLGELKLFDPHEDHDLLSHTFRLRLRPEVLEPERGPFPGIASWTSLCHPTLGVPLLSLGWTISELVVSPGHGITSGTIAVLGDAHLLGRLQAQLGPYAIAAELDNLPARCMLVVTPDCSIDQSTLIQKRALQADCPLIVWCQARPRPSRIAEVVPNGDFLHPPRTQENWLVHFLSLLFKDMDPEQAFFEAGYGGSLVERQARWLRGAFASWRVAFPSKLDRQTIDLPRDWHQKLDRSTQAQELQNAVEQLMEPSDKQRLRVQVVLVPAEEGAGLALFCRRRPSIDQRLHAEAVVEASTAWADAPANQAQSLARALGADSFDTLSGHLRSQAERLRARRPGQPGRCVLFWVQHETMTLRALTGRQVLLPELRVYMAALRDLSLALSDGEVRVLCALPVYGATQRELRKLRQKETRFAVDVLPTLTERPERAEVAAWLEKHIKPSRQELKNMLQFSYEELVRHLAQRYPEIHPL